MRRHERSEVDNRAQCARLCQQKDTLGSNLQLPDHRSGLLHVQWHGPRASMYITLYISRFINCHASPCQRKLGWV